MGIPISNTNYCNDNNIQAEYGAQQTPSISTVLRAKARLQQELRLEIDSIPIAERGIKKNCSERSYSAFLDVMYNFASKLNDLRQAISCKNPLKYSNSTKIIDNIDNLNSDIKEHVTKRIQGKLTDREFKQKLKIYASTMEKHLDYLTQEEIKIEDKDYMRKFSLEQRFCKSIEKYCRLSHKDELERRIDITYIDIYAAFFNEMRSEIENYQLQNKDSLVETLNTLLNILNETTENINNNTLISEKTSLTVLNLILKLYNLIENENNLVLFKKIDAMDKLDYQFAEKKMTLLEQAISEDEEARKKES
jgi:hypothetical protein